MLRKLPTKVHHQGQPTMILPFLSGAQHSWAMRAMRVWSKLMLRRRARNWQKVGHRKLLNDLVVAVVLHGIALVDGSGKQQVQPCPRRRRAGNNGK